MPAWSKSFSSLFKGRDKSRTGKKDRNAQMQEALGAASTPVFRAPRREGPAQQERPRPRFRTNAGDQPNTRSADRFAVVRAKLRHAYTPSQPVADPKMFAGRDSVLQAVIDAIEDQRLHVVIYGERGIGKTSILHMLRQAAREARYIVIYTSCGANSNFDDTFRAAATDIPVLFHSGFAPNAEQVERGGSLADLLPRGPLTPRQFADICSKLTDTRVLVILDEFDRCESAAFRQDIAELIKNLSDRHSRVQLVLGGVAADLTEMVEHIPSIRRNIFALRVPKMTEPEIMQLIANGEAGVGLKFDPSAAELVVNMARGSPHIASLLCHHAGLSALDNARLNVGSSDVALAIEQALREFNNRIGKAVQAHVRRLVARGHGDDLDLAARAALAVDGPFTVADAKEVNEVTNERATTALDRLLKEGLLVEAEHDEGLPSYEFREEALPMFLWMSASQEPTRPVAKSRATAS